MKILVLGAGGMAGHVVSLTLRGKGHDVDTLSDSKKIDDKTIILDVTNKEKFEDFLDNNHYDAVINCIGILVQKSDERKDLAVYLNSFLPHYLERFFAKSKTKIIHMSTDCVFSGKNAPYYEDSEYDGQLFYDRSKALGEIINDKDLTFRMSIIGPDINENGVGLFNWFMAQKGEIFGYTNVYWTGVTTVELAKAMDAALKQNLSGLYNLVPGKNISKYDLLGLFKESFKRDDITINKREDVFSDKTLVNKRKDFDYHVPNYKEMVEEMKKWVNEHPDLYKYYFKR